MRKCEEGEGGGRGRRKVRRGKKDRGGRQREKKGKNVPFSADVEIITLHFV